MSPHIVSDVSLTSVTFTLKLEESVHMSEANRMMSPQKSFIDKPTHFSGCKERGGGDEKTSGEVFEVSHAVRQQQ